MTRKKIPQISPMNWLVLMAFFSLLLLTVWVKVYFLK